MKGIDGTVTLPTKAESQNRADGKEVVADAAKEVVAEKGAVAFVWTIWALLAGAALFLVWSHGRMVPLWDDYLVIPQMTGAEPVTPEWLWTVHYNHRIPLPKLFFVALGRITNCNLPVGMYFNVIALTVLAAIFILDARSLRGWTSFADAFIPLLLLNFGNHRNFLWFWQTSIIIPIFLTGILLLLVVRNKSSLSVWSALLAGVCLLLLPLCGSLGLVFVPSMGLWLAYAGFREFKTQDPSRKRIGLMMLGLVFAAFLLVGLYFLGYHEPSAASRRTWQGWRTLKPIFRTGLQFLSTVLGRLPEHYFFLTGSAAAGIFLLGGLALPVTWLARPADRLRTLGMFLFLGSVFVLVMGIGWGRSGPGWDLNEGLNSRYVTFAALGLLCIYFVWAVFPWPSVGQYFQMGLFTLLCCLIPFNINNSWEDEKYVSEMAASFEQEMQDGVPPTVLTDRFSQTLYYLDSFQFSRERMVKALNCLRDAGVGKFRDLRQDPEFREMPLPLNPVKVAGMTLAPFSFEGDGGADSFMDFVLEKPKFIYALRLKIYYRDKEADPVDCRVAWSSKGQAELASDGRVSLMQVTGLFDQRERPPASREMTVTFWVNDKVSRFRLYPTNKQLDFKISAISLLVPNEPN